MRIFWQNKFWWLLPDETRLTWYWSCHPLLSKNKSDQKPFGTAGCTNIIIWHGKTLCKIKLIHFTIQNQNLNIFQFYHALTSVGAGLTTSTSHIVLHKQRFQVVLLPGNVKEQKNPAKHTVCFSPGRADGNESNKRWSCRKDQRGSVWQRNKTWVELSRSPYGGPSSRMAATDGHWGSRWTMGTSLDK